MPGGGFVQPNRLYLQRGQPLAGAGVAMNHRRYIAYTVVRNGCSGGNLPPPGPQGRNRGTFPFVTTNGKTFSLHWVVPFNRTGCIYHGASPSPGLDGVGSTPLHCTVYWVIPFNRTGCFCHVAGGRLPPQRQCTTFFAFFETQNVDRHVQNTVKRNKCIVGAATCRPPRWMYNLWG